MEYIRTLLTPIQKKTVQDNQLNNLQTKESVIVQFKKQIFYSYGNCQKKQQFPVGVLVGCTGDGKSTLFNKITNKNTATPSGVSIGTRNAISCYSAYGEKFKILDTPGTNYCKDKLRHCLAIRSALIEGPINRIFLIIRFHRVGYMIRNIQEQLLTFSEWANIITIVVTYWDRDDIEENRAMFQETKKNILETLPDIPDSFIFVGQNSDQRQLCEAMYRSLCQNNPVQIEIDLKKFKYKFDIYQNMTKYIKQQKEILNQVEQNILQSIINYQNNDKDEFLHACIANISQIVEEIIDDFIKKHGKDMNKLENYMHYLELKSFSIPIVEKIRKVASQNMSYSLLNLKDPRNQFKKCPHCGQIWLKAEECQGTTNCGSIFYGTDKLKDSQFMKYKYDWKNFQWVIQKLSTSRKLVKKIGCGNILNWSQALPISIEVIEQLKDAGINDIMVDHKEDQNEDFNEILRKESEKAKVYQI